jgi:hypothetical protein
VSQCLGKLVFECFMLPLKFCDCFDSHMIHRFVSSGDKAFRTFDWDIPNCRAIREGVTPALNAARTTSKRRSKNPSVKRPIRSVAPE